MWDEEELMFEAISNPPKGKGKEKDVGKRRAYVRMITSLGGSLNLELYCEKVGTLVQQASGCPFSLLDGASLGSKNMLQFPYARTRREIRQLYVP